ncbi:MAG: hypothetical protein ACYC0V_10045 [Armatimonadota bacterium]
MNSVLIDPDVTVASGETLTKKPLSVPSARITLGQPLPVTSDVISTLARS